MNWCISFLSLILLLAIMDKAESFFPHHHMRVHRRRSRRKHFETKIPLQENFEMFSNKLRKLKLGIKQVKKNHSLIQNFTFYIVLLKLRNRFAGACRKTILTAALF